MEERRASVFRVEKKRALPKNVTMITANMAIS
jgi:hypothetical protein